MNWWRASARLDLLGFINGLTTFMDNDSMVLLYMPLDAQRYTADTQAIIF